MRGEEPANSGFFLSGDRDRDTMGSRGVEESVDP